MRLGTYLGQMQEPWPPLRSADCHLPPSVSVPMPVGILLLTAKPTRPISYENHRQERGQLSHDLWHSKLLQSDRQVF